ncbi:VOC family protein [Robiginitalea sp. IMCC44478]|uniref:VOC family protein n=1 Tax=Robiginitalea sp. IMCC44478 TaxID=3459122 RepID=UPI00404263E7
MQNNHIDYIEFKASDLEKIKSFYSSVFEWKFTDYGPTYTSFEGSGVAGGFEISENPTVNGALIVLYHENLKAVMEKIEAAGGSITRDIFAFPGGERFHFQDPGGNELAVWSDK